MNLSCSRHTPRSLTYLVACAALLVAALTVAHAQTDTGRISGIVRDPNGAVVPGASVTAKNECTGEERSATTNASGIYQIPALHASNYTVTASATSFAPNTITGVQINVVTKSGSNNFRGSVFEYLRNSALDASNFFDNVVGQKTPLRLNQFGGSLGGPIKKEKLFFFGSFEGYRLRNKLAPYGIQIETMVNVGYRLVPAAKASERRRESA